MDAVGAITASLEPEGLDHDAGGWQQRKSAQTRTAILDAAVGCLERYGYAGATTQQIAATADISRGAMLHHYATKQDLIAAVIEYIFWRRMARLRDSITALTEEQRVEEHAGIEIYWQGLLTPEYLAYLELSVAARTDAELRDVFLPRAQQYDALERDMVLSIFPEWSDKRDRYALAMDFCIASMEGLLLNRDIWADRDRRVAYRAFISKVILMLRNGDIDPPARRIG
jgi:AcrR family transcriptional regulator